MKYIAYTTRTYAQNALDRANAAAKLPPGLQVVEIVELEDGKFGLPVIQGLSHTFAKVLERAAVEAVAKVIAVEEEPKEVIVR